MTQPSLWQSQQKSSGYEALCNALFEREIRALSVLPVHSVDAIQGRLKSLPYYVQRTAYKMLSVDTPLILDTQNAAWSAKQSRTAPISGQTPDDVWCWYQQAKLTVGLVVPIYIGGLIVLDSIDRIDEENKRFRTNVYGWFSVTTHTKQNVQLLKPTKKIMMAACAGHSWKPVGPTSPKIPSIRELLLSCSINWRNFRRPLQIIEH